MSGRSIRLLDEARDDLLAGRDFYESLQPGIGAYFWDSLLSDIESLHIHAGVHQRKFGWYRMLARRFPYAVFYELSTQPVPPSQPRRQNQSNNPPATAAIKPSTAK